MATDLLTTKFNIPQQRPAITVRDRLVRKMNAGLAGPITLISAPAGFGKTTLVVDWLGQLPNSHLPLKLMHCAWISLDEQDDQPVRFLRILITAIQGIYPILGGELLDILNNSPKPNVQAITLDLLNDLTAQGQPTIIILDDYHKIQDECTHQLLQTIIDFIPPKTHFVITTRQDPPLSLPRWRARGWLNTVTATDLRFNASETGDFLQHTMGLNLKPEDVTLLEERTEGWVAGLQLAALSLADTGTSPESIQEFGGRDRYIAEYLLAEVFDHQTAEIQQFLLTTSILDRFNANLCSAVLQPEGHVDPFNHVQEIQDRIEALERTNLFIVPLDREGYWYRYHHLFAQLLRQRLARSKTPDEIQDLYRRAAGWYADNGLIEEAINHALKGEDYTFTANLIAGFEIDSLWKQAWGPQLCKWGSQLPSEILREFPRAGFQVALAHMTRNEIKEAVRYITLAREAPSLRAEILVVDSIFARNRGDFNQALALAREALPLFKPRDESMYLAAQTQVVVCLMKLGDLIGAEDLADQLRHKIPRETAQSINVYLQTIHIIGFIKEQRGKLVEAERIYQEGIQTIKASGKTLPLIGLLQVRLGAIYYQWNEIEKAREYCESGMAWGERSGIADIITQGLFVSADLANYQKDEAATQAITQRLLTMLDWFEFEDFASNIQAFQANNDVRLGNLTPAVRWAASSGYSLQDQPSLTYRFEYLTLARVRFAEIRQLEMRDQAPIVAAFVDQMIALFTEHGLEELAITGWLQKALLSDYNKQSNTAVESLHRALDLANPGGFIRIFLDFGLPLRDLLQKSLAYDSHMVYKRRLLSEFANEGGTKTTSVASSHEFPITLTPREFEILGLIAAGLSNKAIQEQLTLSKNTVRTHIKNLYSKIGVNSRTQAIQQARENGLI